MSGSIDMREAVARLAGDFKAPDPDKGERVLGRGMASLLQLSCITPHPVHLIGSSPAEKRLARRKAFAVAVAMECIDGLSGMDARAALEAIEDYAREARERRT